MRTGHRDLIRDLNRTLVLNLVRQAGGLSRAAVARASGLSPSTVTAITASLIDEGFLLEDDEPTPIGPTTTIGRPPTLLRIDPRAGDVVGIKVAPDQLTAIVTDLEATPLGMATITRGRETDPIDVADLIARAMDGAIAAAGIDRRRIMGIGIGVPGPVDPETGRVLDSPLFGWGHLDLVVLLEDRLGIRVLLDNDVNTLTVAEQLFGSGRGLANLVVVTVGHGIGMGLVINGVVHRGARGGAGEFGHVQVVPSGPDCWCGRRGCLEAVAAEPAVVRDILAATGRLAQVTEIKGLAERDPNVADIVARAGAHIGRALATVTTILDPNRVVLSGEGVRLGPVYLDAIRQSYLEHEQKEEPTDLVIEPWGDEAWARGAASLVLRELFQPAHLRDEATATPSPPERMGSTRRAAGRGRGDRR